MKKLHVKAILSTLLMLIFIFLAITGALLYFGKTGVVLGFSRQALRETHFWASAIMCALIAAHLALNCKLYLTELKALLRMRNEE